MRRLRSKAFTLVEVLGSMVILAGAIVGVILCNADGLAASRNIERMVKSTLNAEMEMEEIKASLADNFTQSWVGLNHDHGDNIFVKSSVRIVPGNPNLKKVEVSAGYDTSGNGILTADEIMFTLTTQVVDMEGWI